MLLKIDSLSLAIKNVKLVSNLNASFGPSLNLIWGANGSGKTTILTLLEHPTNDSKNITHTNIHNISAFNLSTNGLCSSMTGNEILQIFSISKNQSAQENPISQSSLFKKCLEKTTSELSNGMKQIFKYYLHTFWNPDLILLDEPLSFLDDINKDLILDDIKTRSKKSIIFFTSQRPEIEIKEIQYRLRLGQDA